MLTKKIRVPYSSEIHLSFEWYGKFGTRWFQIRFQNWNIFIIKKVIRVFRPRAFRRQTLETAGAWDAGFSRIRENKHLPHITFKITFDEKMSSGTLYLISKTVSNQ